MAFRLRITLLSLATSGVLLVGFGIYFLATLQSVGLERIDREIRAVAEGQLRGPRPGRQWENIARSLRFIYGEAGSARLAIQMRDVSGRVLFTSPTFPEEISTLPPPALAFLPPKRPRSGDPRGKAGPGARHGRPPRQRDSVFRTVETSKGPWRVGFLGNEDVTLVVGIDLADLSREASRFRRAFFVATPSALLGLAVAGWWLASRALRPVALLTRTAESVTAGGLDQRVPVVAADHELRRLVDVINGMLARLERSFEQAMRFSSDAAHELQTPLTVLQGELDNAIQAAADGSQEQRNLNSLLEEVRRLKAVVHKLLLLARADAGRLYLQSEAVDLTDLLASAIEDVEALAPGMCVESAIAPGVSVLADPDLLNQVVLNMTINAVKYGEEHGVIRFELTTEDKIVRFTLGNSGKPIPWEDRERIFDRFYRLDASRDGRVGGSGLGLSLAREIARAHGGDLTLGPDQPGLTVFVLTLPRPPGSLKT